MRARETCCRPQPRLLQALCSSCLLLHSASAALFYKPGHDQFQVHLCKNQKASAPVEGSGSVAVASSHHVPVQRDSEHSTDAAETQSGLSTSDGEVSMVMRGVPFSCVLPPPAVRNVAFMKHRGNYIVSARSAALLSSLCLHGEVRTETAHLPPLGTSGSKTFELCIQRHFKRGQHLARWQEEYDQPLEGGGFRQAYFGEATGSTPQPLSDTAVTVTSGGGTAASGAPRMLALPTLPLQVHLQCHCLPPGPEPVEPPCRPGDRVHARHPGRAQGFSPAFVAGIEDSEGSSPTWLKLIFIHNASSSEHRAAAEQVLGSAAASSRAPSSGQAPASAAADKGPFSSPFVRLPSDKVFSWDWRSCMAASSRPSSAGRHWDRLLRVQDALFSETASLLSYNITVSAATCCKLQTVTSPPHNLKAGGDGRRGGRGATLAKMPGHSGSQVAGSRASPAGAPQAEKEKEQETSPVRNSSAVDSSDWSKLLSPLSGRCFHAVVGWWTYEVCWPWRVRQLHVGLSGSVEDQAITLGHFNAEIGGISKERSHRVGDGPRNELYARLHGESCAATTHKWTVKLLDSKGVAELHSFQGVGGTFNPSGVVKVAGTITGQHANSNGCRPYGSSLNGRIALVRRGGCWFHSKVLHAQTAGAAALVVYNENLPMVDAMEGVDDLSAPHIPVILVDAAAGVRLQQLLAGGDQHTVLQKAAADGVDLSQPIATSVVFHCNAQWRERREACQVGDEVDVKFFQIADQATVEKHWPLSMVRVVNAIITKILPEEEMFEVIWSPQAESMVGAGFPDWNGGVVGPLPDKVPMNVTYRDGITCGDFSADAFIDGLAEPQACHSEISVHVAALCAYPSLFAPAEPKPPQLIQCTKDQGSKSTDAAQERDAPP